LSCVITAVSLSLTHPLTPRIRKSRTSPLSPVIIPLIAECEWADGQSAGREGEPSRCESATCVRPLTRNTPRIAVGQQAWGNGDRRRQRQSRSSCQPACAGWDMPTCAASVPHSAMHTNTIGHHTQRALRGASPRSRPARPSVPSGRCRCQHPGHSTQPNGFLRWCWLLRSTLAALSCPPLYDSRVALCSARCLHRQIPASRACTRHRLTARLRAP